MDHIQSVNGVNRIDFYKAILLVEGQPIEYIIDIGSPITNIPPIFSKNKLMKTTKGFVHVNKNPIKFRGEALAEVKAEKSKVTLQYSSARIKTHYWGLICWINWKSDYKAAETQTKSGTWTRKARKSETNLKNC